jgi:hypothetical protein
MMVNLFSQSSNKQDNLPSLHASFFFPCPLFEVDLELVFPLGTVGDVDLVQGRVAYTEEAVATCFTRTFTISKKIYNRMIFSEDIEDGLTKSLVQKIVEARQTWRDLRSSLAKNNPEVFIPITPKMQRESLTIRYNKATVPCCGIPNFVVKAINSDKRKAEMANQEVAQEKARMQNRRKTTGLPSKFEKSTFIPSPPFGSPSLCRKLSVAAGEKGGQDVLDSLARIEDRQQQKLFSSTTHLVNPSRRRLSSLPSTGSLHSSQEQPMNGMKDGAGIVQFTQSLENKIMGGEITEVVDQKRRISNFMEGLKMDQVFVSGLLCFLFVFRLCFCLTIISSCRILSAIRLSALFES